MVNTPTLCRVTSGILICADMMQLERERERDRETQRELDVKIPRLELVDTLCLKLTDPLTLTRS